MGNLDPVSLLVLAEHLRDETWLDMRVVEHGLLERVLIEGILVKVDDEELDVRQEWMEGGEVVADNFIVACENIRWCRPSVFDPEDVTPVTLTEAAKGGTNDFRWELVCRAAQLIFLMDDAAWKRNIEGTPLRYTLMLAMYEISDESDHTICMRLDYLSPTPMQSARWTVPKDTEKMKGLRRIVAACAEKGYGPLGRPKTIL